MNQEDYLNYISEPQKFLFGMSIEDVALQLGISVYDADEFIQNKDDIVIIKTVLDSIREELEKKRYIRDMMQQKYRMLLETGEYQQELI